MTDKWDNRFLALARHISEWSRDPSTKVGAVIVRPDKSVCSMGFNGFPKKMVDLPEYYENRDEKYSRIIHAEANALIFAREPVKGYTLYTWPLACCDRCTVQMIQAGIARFVFPKLPEKMLDRWDKSVSQSKQYILTCGADYTEI
jgi:dCMP deaminase